MENVTKVKIKNGAQTFIFKVRNSELNVKAIKRIYPLAKGLKYLQCGRYNKIVFGDQDNIPLNFDVPCYEVLYSSDGLLYF